jgi:hypothetical protein
MSARLATGAFAVLVSLMLIAGLVWIFKGSTTGTELSEHAIQIDHAERKDRPFLAIWQADGGLVGGAYLRIAIWDDGRIRFAQDQKKWSHALRQGRISADQIARLKEDILKTGVFELKGYCYLVPDADMDCLLLDFSGMNQMLYWDEVEAPNYGINIDPKPHHLKFKECWKMVNELALKVVPVRSEPAAQEFRSAPKSWYLKEVIQSE